MFIVCQYYPVTTLELNLSVLRVLFAAKDMQRILVAPYMHVYARNLSIKESYMQTRHYKVLKMYIIGLARSAVHGIFGCYFCECVCYLKIIH